MIANGAKTHCPAGHEYTPENTRKDALGRRTCRACDRESRKTPERRARHAQLERERRRRRGLKDTRRLFVEVGQRFGRGVVVDADVRVTRNRRGARLLCDCGNSYETWLQGLLAGRVNSCGCLRRDHTHTPSTHGLSKHPLYSTWRSMVQRCENPSLRTYPSYGGRGITVCPEWHDVAIFIAWIEANLGPRPAGTSLDRIDNDGNYEPGNVRWATNTMQARNRRVRQDISLVAERMNQARLARRHERIIALLEGGDADERLRGLVKAAPPEEIADPIDWTQVNP